MKKLSKLFAALLAVMLLISVVSPAASAAGTAPETLKFKDGKFKILVLSDIQDTDKPQKATIAMIHAAIEKAQPDFIVLTGDNTAGPWKNADKESTAKAVDCVASVINEKKIPFALVFGNHDHQGLEKIGIPEEEGKKFILSCYQKYEYCMAVEGEEMTGVGNYSLPIKDSAGEKDIFNLWFMDSNPSTPEELGGGYGYVREDQIQWYEKTSNALKEKNGGKPMPSLLFQHIIVPEVFGMLSEVPEGTGGAVRDGDKYYVANPDFIYQGEVNEIPCPSNYNGGQFESWVKQGDIVGAFFGHDHTNDFAGEYKGIKLVAVPGVTYYSYGNHRGVRTITLSEDKLTDFESEILLCGDLGVEKAANPFVEQYGYSAFESDILPDYILAFSIGIPVLAAALAAVIIIVKKKKRNS